MMSDVKCPNCGGEHLEQGFIVRIGESSNKTNETICRDCGAYTDYGEWGISVGHPTDSALHQWLVVGSLEYENYVKKYGKPHWPKKLQVSE